MITMRDPRYETLDYRNPAREAAAAIDAAIAARHPHLRAAIESGAPAGRELRRLRRQPAGNRNDGQALALRRRQLELLRLAAS